MPDSEKLKRRWVRFSLATLLFISLCISGLFGGHKGLKYMTELPKESAWSPEALAGAGLR